MSDAEKPIQSPRDGSVQTTEQPCERGRSGEATPSRQNDDRNTTYHRDVYKDSERTGLKATDRHATWREVYHACHVGVGVDD